MGSQLVLVDLLQLIVLQVEILQIHFLLLKLILQGEDFFLDFLFHVVIVGIDDRVLLLVMRGLGSDPIKGFLVLFVELEELGL